MFILTTVPTPIDGDYNNPNGNPTHRLAQIRGKIVDAERRVRDLEALLTFLIMKPNDGTIDTDPNLGGTQPISDLADATDANSVRQALYQARADEGELRTAEQFWNQIVDGNKQAEKDTHDLFKRA